MPVPGVFDSEPDWESGSGDTETPKKKKKGKNRSFFQVQSVLFEVGTAAFFRSLKVIHRALCINLLSFLLKKFIFLLL